MLTLHHKHRHDDRADSHTLDLAYILISDRAYSHTYRMVEQARCTQARLQDSSVFGSSQQDYSRACTACR